MTETDKFKTWLEQQIAYYEHIVNSSNYVTPMRDITMLSVLVSILHKYEELNED